MSKYAVKGWAGSGKRMGTEDGSHRLLCARNGTSGGGPPRKGRFVGGEPGYVLVSTRTREIAVSDLMAVDFFTDRSILVDPFPYYESVRMQGPVWREPHHGAFVVTSYEVISAIYRDPETFSSCNSFGGPFVTFPEEGEVADLIECIGHTFPNGESFITWDPPEHTAHRGLMMRLLTPKRLQENSTFIAHCADEQIEPLRGARRVRVPERVRSAPGDARHRRPAGGASKRSVLPEGGFRRPGYARCSGRAGQRAGLPRLSL